MSLTRISAVCKPCGNPVETQGETQGFEHIGDILARIISDLSSRVATTNEPGDDRDDDAQSDAGA